MEVIGGGLQVCSLDGQVCPMCCAVSPDGKRVVSGGAGRAVTIWNSETGGKMLSLGGHNGEGICLCTMDSDGELEWDHAEPLFHPGCPVIGHTGTVDRVQFTNDGAQVVSPASEDNTVRVVSASEDNTVRVWDVASGRQVCELPGREFALVEGLSDERHPDLAAFERQRARHVLTARGNTLLIFQVAKEQAPAEDGAAGAAGAAAAPVACFMAPQRITSVRCHAAAICVACVGGAVCILSAPFLVA